MTDIQMSDSEIIRIFLLFAEKNYSSRRTALYVIYHHNPRFDGLGTLTRQPFRTLYNAIYVRKPPFQEYHINCLLQSMHMQTIHVLIESFSQNYHR